MKWTSVSYLESAFVVLDAPVQIKSAGSKLAILELLTIGPDCCTGSFDVSTGVCKLRGRGDREDKQREEAQVLQEELHDALFG